MTDAAVAAFGRIDILVSNAALRRQTPFTEMSFAEWREILSVALDGAFICARACVPHMMAAGGGAIVTLGGISTHVGTKNRRSEEHTSELQSLMRISYAVFCLKKKNISTKTK